MNAKYDYYMITKFVDKIVKNGVKSYLKFVFFYKKNIQFTIINQKMIKYLALLLEKYSKLIIKIVVSSISFNRQMNWYNSTIIHL